MRGVDLGVASENYRIASHHTLRAKVVRWDRKRQIFGIHPEPATDSAALSVRFWEIFGRINGFWPPKTRCPAEGFIFSLYLNTVFWYDGGCHGCCRGSIPLAPARAGAFFHSAGSIIR